MNFVVVEGVNGAGKSSLIEHLAERGALSWEGPKLDVGSVRPTMLESGSPLARYMYLLSLNYQVSAEVSAVPEGRLCVVSRYLWSSVAYQIARESVAPGPEREWLLMTGAKLSMPRCVVQLDVERSTQAERLALRTVTGRARYGMDASAFDAFDAQMREALDQLRTTSPVPWYRIDTTALGVTEVASRFHELIGEYE